MPYLLRPIAGPIKKFIRALCYWRLSRLPLTMRQAQFWAGKFKDWPAIFVDGGYSKQKIVAGGFVLQLGLIDVIERSLFVHGCWDELVRHALETLLKPGDRFLDIGANIGYFSLLASNLVGENGLVMAVEPSRRACEKLLTNLRLNHASNVMVMTLAAGEMTHVAQLQLSTPNNIGATSLRKTLTATGSELVLVMRLDDVIGPLDFVPSVIKIDIEGGELNALKGLEHILKQGRSIVLAELTDAFLVEFGQSALELITYMNSIGYTCYELSFDSALKARPLPATHKCIPKHQTEVLFSVCGLENSAIQVLNEAA